MSTFGTLLLTLALALVLAPVHGWAQQSGTTKSEQTWANLNSLQQKALAPLAAEWDRLPTDSQRKWLEIAQRFHTLPAEQQGRALQRMRDWSSLTPAQRGEVRVNFQEARQLSTQDKQAQWEAYRALPAEQRQALAEKARAQEATASGQSRSPSQALRPSSLAAQSPKQNLVPAPGLGVASTKAIAPTLVQSPRGATTALVTAKPSPPAHQQAGKGKVAANSTDVNRTTLLPRTVTRPPAPAASTAVTAEPAVTPR